MKINICSICGAKLDPTRESEKDYRFFKNKKGYFIIQHVNAVVDKKNKVYDHMWNDTVETCPDCTDKIDLAIQKAVGDILLASPSSRTIKVKAPFFDTEPHKFDPDCECRG